MGDETTTKTQTQTNPTNIASHICSSIGCGKPASLKCPTCTKLGLPESFFCTQECFKATWIIHKLVHTAAPSDPTLRIPDHFRGFIFTGPLRPTQLTPKRAIPAGIKKPEYADHPLGEAANEKRAKAQHVIEVKTKAQIEGTRKACKISREILDIAAAAVKPGVTTDEIDRIVHEATIERNAYPSPLNYYNFPKSCCTSVNEVICHGIPDLRPLENGDIVNIDISAYYGGYHGDVNATYYVGEVDAESRNLVEAARECLNKALDIVKPGTLYREVGDVIQKVARQRGVSVVRSYCGHGIGEHFHTAPNVPHYGKNKAVGVMKPGHIFTIEPMINAGVWQDVLWPDHWTAVTRDGKRSAQFEHTILVTENGHEILTGSRF